jgi:TonB-linked SusC/RagA family outer membrane protein
MGKSSLYITMLGFFLSTQLLWTAQLCSQDKYTYVSGNKNEHRLRNALPDSSVAPFKNFRKQPLLDVLIELNRTRGVYFLFSQQPSGRILVNPPSPESGLPIERILDQVLRNTGLRFKKINEKTFVILGRKDTGNRKDNDAAIGGDDADDDSASLNRVDLSRNIVAGRVISSDGKILQGVSITVKGKNKGTSSDGTGVFSIEAGDPDILVFSFVGYKGREMPVGSAGTTRIVLEPSDQPLTEVLVTALGIRKQERSLGYSTTELDGSSFIQSREINLGNALTGQVAGLSVLGNATGPYGSSRVVIRGNASLSGNNQPLYVIDGVPYDNTNQAYAAKWGGSDLGDGLSNINPDDIESVLVLKGVASSALYGYRGGNGAILVTTKSGSKTHGMAIQFNNNVSVTQALDPRDYQYVYGQGLSGLKPVSQESALSASYYSWGSKLDGSKAVNFLGDTYSYLPAKNNFSNFLRTGITNQSSVALTGGNNRGHFRLALSDLLLNTVVPNSNMAQQGLDFNSTYAVTGKLQVSLKADYVYEQVKNRASLSDDPGNVMAAPLYLANSFDIRWMKDHRSNPDGTEHLPGNTDPYFENPYYIAYDYQNLTTRNRLTGGLTLKYNLLDWLWLQGQVSRDGYIFDVTQIVPSGVQYTRSDGVHGGNLTQYEVNYHELNSSFMIGMNKKFGKDFTLDANLGGNRMDNISQTDGIGAVPNSGNRPAGPFIIANYYNPLNIAVKPPSSYHSHYRVNSLYASADLGYKNYLFFSVAARNDWFSTLNINTDRYLYPSISSSFLFTEAWRLPAWISAGKLRASYAGSSNGTEPYQNELNYGLQGYTANGQTIAYVATQGLIPDASLRPVSISEKEFGLNLQMLENRLGIDLAFYDKNTKNDIVKVTASPTSGYTQQVKNIGEVRNRGFELLLTAVPIKTQYFRWNFSFNFADNDNKVLYLGGPSSIVIDGAYARWGSEVSISNVVGRPYGQIMGFAYRRDNRGNIIYSDGISNPAPAGEPEQTGVIPLGSSMYKETGGLTNEFHYRNFSLSFLVDFKYGAKIYSGTNLLLYYYGLQQKTLQGREDGHIGKGMMENGHPNSIAVPAQQYFQDISAGGSDHIAEEFVYDASFIKLRALSLSYEVPASWFKDGVVKGMNISLTGRNLAVLMKHTPNIDPESGINNTNGQGLELSAYPATRSFGFNLNLKF